MESVRLMLALVGIFDFRVWSLDVRQAYLQATAENMRDIFCEATEELNLHHDKTVEAIATALLSRGRWRPMEPFHAPSSHTGSRHVPAGYRQRRLRASHWE